MHTDVQAEAPRTSWHAELAAEYELIHARLRIIVADDDEGQEYI